MYIDIPIKEGLICQRTGDGEVAVNVPVYVVHHSPTGWEWGYAGSGPADLALNTVQHILMGEGFFGNVTHSSNWFRPPAVPIFGATALIYQNFKFKFIATMPYEGGTIPYAEMFAFINASIVNRGH